jgi:[acyl-carrier-protein] S-malonyltransferase
MGRDLYAESPAAREIFEQADATLGFALTRLCFEGPESDLTATENAQPALLTVSTALLAALAEGYETRHRRRETEDRRQEMRDAQPPTACLPVSAAFVAGHSLGEYSALVAGGALDFPTALRLVRRRGELMAAAGEGMMAAIIGMDEEPLEAVCREASSEGAPVVIANYNSPGQLVISGATSAAERAMALAKARGARRALPLKVSAAFHSPLMQAAADGLAELVGAAAIADAHMPVLSNVLATPLAEAEAIRQELVAQVTSPVRWIASVRHMVESGVDTFVEVGPGAVLSGLIRRIAPGARLANVDDLVSVRAFLQEGD